MLCAEKTGGLKPAHSPAPPDPFIQFVFPLVTVLVRKISAVKLGI